VDWRAEHGGFTDVAQLQDVTGIGPSKYADIKNLVTP
jgi:competence protein ComEA